MIASLCCVPNMYRYMYLYMIAEHIVFMKGLDIKAMNYESELLSALGQCTTFIKISINKRLFGVQACVQELKKVETYRLCPLIRHRKCTLSCVYAGNCREPSLNLYSFILKFYMYTCRLSAL